MIYLQDKNRWKFAFSFLLLVLVTTGGIIPPAQAAEDDHEELVIFTPVEIEEFGIQITEAGPGRITLTRSLPGEVQVNDNRLAHIGPRYEGIVTKVNATVGDAVKEGQILAVVESDGTLATYELKTFISGTIIEKHMTLGEPVSRENAGFVVADLSTVWIDITVYQRDLDLITVGKEATFRTSSQDRTYSGKISYITPVVDKHTRTATARMVVSNPDGYWKPGMFIMTEVVTEKIDAAVVVPATAVHTMENSPVIFVETGEGFHPQHVTIGRKGSTQLEILSGLEIGERYVSVGGFVMKAELGKDSLGEGHEH